MCTRHSNNGKMMTNLSTFKEPSSAYGEVFTRLSDSSFIAFLNRNGYSGTGISIILFASGLHHDTFPTYRHWASYNYVSRLQIYIITKAKGIITLKEESSGVHDDDNSIKRYAIISPLCNIEVHSWDDSNSKQGSIETYVCNKANSRLGETCKTRTKTCKKISKQTLGKLAQGLSLWKSIGQFTVAKFLLACNLELCPIQFLQLFVQDEDFPLPRFCPSLIVIPFNHKVSWNTHFECQRTRFHWQGV